MNSTKWRVASSEGRVKIKRRFASSRFFFCLHSPLLVIPAMCLLLFASFTSGDEAKPSDFVHDVVPILKAHCAECHADGPSQGRLSIDTRGDDTRCEGRCSRQKWRERTLQAHRFGRCRGANAAERQAAHCQGNRLD